MASFDVSHTCSYSSSLHNYGRILHRFRDNARYWSKLVENLFFHTLLIQQTLPENVATIFAPFFPQRGQGLKRYVSKRILQKCSFYSQRTRITDRQTEMHYVLCLYIYFIFAN